MGARRFMAIPVSKTNGCFVEKAQRVADHDETAALEAEIARLKAENEALQRTVSAWLESGQRTARQIVDDYCESHTDASESERARLAAHLEPLVNRAEAAERELQSMKDRHG